MIITGLKLTILGMSVVTCFLLLLILIINLSYKLLAAQTSKELDEFEAAELKKRKKSLPAKQTNSIVAVITAAVAAHRSRDK
jgi:sodium pump decarboxylase gamma subunit